MKNLMRSVEGIRVAVFGAALLLVASVGAQDPPVPPNLSEIDLDPVLDAYANIADSLEQDLKATESTIEELLVLADDTVNDPVNEPLECIAPLGVTFLGVFVGSFFAPAGADLAFDVVSYGLDIALKHCKPYLRVDDVPETGFDPADDDGDDECRLEVDQVTEEGHTTFLAVPRGGSLTEPRLDEWGPLGNPTSIQINSDVSVELKGAHHTPGDETLAYPLGIHTLTWEAVTQISPLDLVFLYIPGLPESAKRYFGANGTEVLEALISIAVDVALFELSAGESENEFLARIQTGEPNSPPTRRFSTLTVWDLVDPEIETASGTDIIEFEGLEPGGASIKTQRDRLRPLISVSDKCRDPSDLELREPANFWPVNVVSEAEWTVLDPGPNMAGGRNSASVTQFVRVIDTLAPELLAPPSQVSEVDGGVTSAFVPLGAPRTFDLVDLSPTINRTIVPDNAVPVDGGYEFPVGVTEVQWCAVDGSGNDSCAGGIDPLAVQLINVKEAGTNTVPDALSQTGSNAVPAGGFEPVEIIVEGFDPDFDAVSGRFDPLSFEITKAPENGFFVAPLLPYFIDDYRIPFQNNIDRCTENRPPEVIVEPQNIRVSESGKMYVLTPSLEIDPGCDPNDPFFFLPNNRISIFDTNGPTQEYLLGRDLPRAADLFGFYFDEKRNRIVYTTPGPRVLVLDGDTLETLREFEFGSISGIRKAVLDGNDMLYTSTGSARVNTWDATTEACPNVVCDLSDRLIQELTYIPDELSTGGEGVPIDLALTSDDSLIIGTFFHLYQFTPSSLDAEGTPIPGNLVGFLGACSDGDGCDVVTETTRGFSCTHDTCEALYPGGGGPTDRPGQLSSAASIALDPNDAIYVADRNNRRVQRFTKDGFYAGQARSSCASDDVDRCLQEGFVLANFGRPDTISVNSKHLYVLDENPALELVHVFQTSVLTTVSDSEASITYQSNNGFSGTDTFEFRATDGFDVSDTGVVEIAVVAENRNAPTANDMQVTVQEDEPTPIVLEGRDDDFGPDVLTYRVEAGPTNGSLTGLPGAALTYTPSPDFFGEDSFTYVAEDGTFDSTPATVSITVEPVPDAPVLNLPRDFFAELDEPAYFAFSFTDADPDSVHTVEIDWGDGTVEQEGIINDDGTTTGPILTETNVVRGFVFGFHQYQGPAREVEVIACILPAGEKSVGKGVDQEIACDSTIAKVDLDQLFSANFE